jgi:hypothetical protein
MDGLPVLPESLRGSIGGARRDRTADLLIANEALSQLSYGPAWRSEKGPLAPVEKARGAI